MCVCVYEVVTFFTSWRFWWTSFPVCFLIFTKIWLIVSLSNKYFWSFKHVESNQFKVDIKFRIVPTWNADMWWTNIRKTACARLSPLQMSNQIAKFSSWKSIAVTGTLCQHNINAITTHFRYLIRQFQSTSEWDLIFHLATLGAKEHSNF